MRGEGTREPIGIAVFDPRKGLRAGHRPPERGDLTSSRRGHVGPTLEGEREGRRAEVEPLTAGRVAGIDERLVARKRREEHEPEAFPESADDG